MIATADTGIDAEAVTALEFGDISRNLKGTTGMQQAGVKIPDRNASDRSRYLTVPAITTAGFTPLQNPDQRILDQ